MGWGDCGTDIRGRPIGYLHEATCDEPGCKAVIDRGLGYACGGMHGAFDCYCEGYFCGNHLYFTGYCDEEGELLAQICGRCLEEIEDCDD